jgi:hypothetical protein
MRLFEFKETPPTAKPEKLKVKVVEVEKPAVQQTKIEAPTIENLAEAEATAEYTDDDYQGDCMLVNQHLTSLEGQCPEIVHGEFDCSHNDIKSLDGCPQEIHGYASFRGNRLTNLKNIDEHIHYAEILDFSSNPIESHVLGLLKIKGLHNVVLDNRDVTGIINMHLRHHGGKNLYRCEMDLKMAGFGRFAEE